MLLANSDFNNFIYELDKFIQNLDIFWIQISEFISTW